MSAVMKTGNDKINEDIRVIQATVKYGGLIKGLHPDVPGSNLVGLNSFSPLVSILSNN